MSCNGVRRQSLQRRDLDFILVSQVPGEPDFASRKRMNRDFMILVLNH